MVKNCWINKSEEKVWWKELKREEMYVKWCPFLSFYVFISSASDESACETSNCNTFKMHMTHMKRQQKQIKEIDTVFEHVSAEDIETYNWILITYKNGSKCFNCKIIKKKHAAENI